MSALMKKLLWDPKFCFDGKFLSEITMAFITDANSQLTQESENYLRGKHLYLMFALVEPLNN